MKLKIEQGIEIPKSSVGRRDPTGLASQLREMKPGDSALLPAKTKGNHSGTFAYVFGNGNYASRRMEGGIRVWRLR